MVVVVTQVVGVWNLQCSQPLKMLRFQRDFIQSNTGVSLHWWQPPLQLPQELG
jgi:hypothetical protein